MKYKFSMEKILNWRTGIEKVSMEEFAILQNELHHEKLVLANLEKEYKKSKDKNLDNCNVNELMQQHLYVQNIKDKIENQNKVISIKKNQVEESRDKLVIAQKDRKVMEKLKEKDYDDFQENMKLEEQKELDEMAVLRFQRLAD